MTTTTTLGLHDDALSRLQELARVPERPGPADWVDEPRLGALQRTGTRHVYVDSGDVRAIQLAVHVVPESGARAIDGNTVNQPLLEQVIDDFPDGDRPEDWARALRADTDLDPERCAWLVHTLALARVANECRRRFGEDHPWETSLQLHMAACRDRETALELAHLQRILAPETLVKVPFLPDAPDCLLVARDLEREGIPVNLTSTFSARQVVTGALLANVSRTNVFAGRLDSGLSADRLGVTVCLEAQRRLRALRDNGDCKSLLIVASVRGADVVSGTAGCDCYTIPPEVLSGFREGSEALRDEVALPSAEEPGISPTVRSVLPREDVLRLSHVERAFVDYLRRLAGSEAWESMRDGEELRAAFDEAGFGDVFARPDEGERRLLRERKVPDVEGELVGRYALDTLFSLHGNADFDSHQEAIDDRSRDAASGG